MQPPGWPYDPLALSRWRLLSPRALHAFPVARSSILGFITSAFALEASTAVLCKSKKMQPPGWPYNPLTFCRWRLLPPHGGGTWRLLPSPGGGTRRLLSLRQLNTCACIAILKVHFVKFGYFIFALRSLWQAKVLPSKLSRHALKRPFATICVEFFRKIYTPCN